MAKYDWINFSNAEHVLTTTLDVLTSLLCPMWHILYQELIL